MIEKRLMDELELGTAPTTFTTQGYEYRGNLNFGALIQAYNLLCIRHPLLKAAIERVDGKSWLTVPEVSHPEAVFIRGDERSLGHLDREGHFTVQSHERKVANLLVVYEQGHGYVLLKVRHSFVNHSSMIAFLRELFSFYADIVNKTEIDVKPGSLQRPPLEILKEFWGEREMRGALSDQSDINESENFEQSETTVLRVLTFSPADTKAVFRTARDLQVTVGSLLVGAGVTALHTCEPQLQTATVTTRVSLRNRLDRTIGDTETSHFSGDCHVKLDLSEPANLATIGKTWKAETDQKVEHANIDIQGYTSDARVMRKNRNVNSKRIIFNNIGVMPEIDVPGDVELVDFVIKPYIYDLSIKEIATEISVPAWFSHVTIASWSYGNKLNLLLGHPNSIKNFVPELCQKLGVERDLD